MPRIQVAARNDRARLRRQRVACSRPVGQRRAKKRTGRRIVAVRNGTATPQCAIGVEDRIEPIDAEPTGDCQPGRMQLPTDGASQLDGDEPL
jgi:hypothetical protein